MNRRTAMKALSAAFGICAARAGVPMEIAGDPRADLRWIDMHCHVNAPAFNDFNIRFGGQRNPPPWTLESMMRDMDDAGVSLAVLSGWTPAEGGTAADRASVARGTNEYIARLAKDFPGRFALFATLPLPDIEASIQEALYALDHLGAVGLTVYTDAGKAYLGDPMFNDLYAELDRRGAVVFAHPHAPACCAGVVPGVPDSLIEFGTATSRTIASLIFSGQTLRHPRIKWIFSHGGGTVPYLIERFLGGTQAEIVPGIVTRGQPSAQGVRQPPGSFLAELRKMYFDTAQIANPAALQTLKTVVGTSRILFGTDVWYRTEKETAQAVVASAVFSPDELQQIARGNALKLVPALARVEISQSRR
ncbi:MAG: amidohydrolase family protein [Pseudomonadota bacterium]